MIQNQDISLLSQPFETPKINRHTQSIKSAASSVQDRLEQKIEMMSRSLAQVPTTNGSKSMQMLRSIQKERQKSEKQQRNVCKQLLQDVNSIEKAILTFDKDRIIKNSQQKIAEQEVFRVLNQCESQFRRIRENNHQKLSQFSDKISTSKISMIEEQEENKQIVSRLQRQTQTKLNNLEKEANFNQTALKTLNQRFIKEFRNLRSAIEEQKKEAEKETSKNVLRLDSVRAQWTRKLQEQRNKQKMSFQRNYDALEQIFRFMSQQ